MKNAKGVQKRGKPATENESPRGAKKEKFQLGGGQRNALSRNVREVPYAWTEGVGNSRDRSRLDNEGEGSEGWIAGGKERNSIRARTPESPKAPEMCGRERRGESFLWRDHRDESLGRVGGIMSLLRSSRRGRTQRTRFGEMQLIYRQEKGNWKDTRLPDKKNPLES